MGRSHQLVEVWPERPASAKILKTAKISSEESSLDATLFRENLHQRKSPAIRYVYTVALFKSYPLGDLRNILRLAPGVGI